MGKALGATVIAVAGGAEKLAFCAHAGADAGIDYRQSEIGAELNKLTDGVGVDVIFDPVGGVAATQSLAGLRSRGRFAVIGFASGSWVDIDPEAAVLRNHTMVGVFAGGYSVAEDNAINAHLGEMAAVGLINTAVGPVHGFDQVPAVLEGLPISDRPGKAVVQLDRGGNP